MLPPEDMSAFIGLFLDEATEQIAILEDSILHLETGASAEVLQEIFRAAHTLKGSARSMGFTGMGELTHVMEDAFERLRSGTLRVSRELIDGLFKAVDQLKACRDEIAANGFSEIDTSAVTEVIRALVAGRADILMPQPAIVEAPAPLPGRIVEFRQAPPGLTVRMAVHQAYQCGMRVYDVTIGIARDCAMRSVRAVLVLHAMEQVGSVLFTTPDEEALEGEKFDFVFGLVLATDRTPEEVVQTARSVAEIEHVAVADTVDLYADEAAPDEATAHVSEPASGEPISRRPMAAADIDAMDTPPVPLPDRPLGTSHTHTVRVDVTRLDNLLNLVGELVIDQTRLAEIAVRMRSQPRIDDQIEQLRDAASHLGRITSEMQEEIMKARMLPLDNLFARFPRMVRDLAHKLGREIEFTVTGRDTELDRSVIEVIGDPLIHLLRNCVDHGIEPPDVRKAAGKPARGKVAIGARHEESHIVIEIEDDGRGMDPDRIRAKAVAIGMVTAEAAARLSDKDVTNLIFAPGFSTADTVTEVSGRGVGMDIVRNNLTRFGATFEVDSRVGSGSKFTIKLPLTLAIIRGLLVKAAAGVYVLPLASVVEAMQVETGRIRRVNHREVVLSRGGTLPLLRLTDLFKPADYEESRIIDLKPEQRNAEHIVVVGAANERIGVIVDTLLGEQEIVIKSLSKHVGDVKGISGATILGDGRIALILDVNGLLTIATERKVEAYAA